MSGQSGDLSLDAFIASEQYKEEGVQLAANELDANLQHILEIVNGRSKEEREVVSRLLGAVVTHMDKKLATRLLRHREWTDEQFVGGAYSDIMLKDTRADGWEIQQQIAGAARFRQLVKTHGGALTVKEVSQLTETTEDGVIKQINRGNLIAYKAASIWYILKAQFEADGSIVAGVKETLKALSPVSRIDQVRFFLTSIEGSKDTPLGLLKKAKSPSVIARVTRLAEDFMVHGGA